LGTIIEFLVQDLVKYSLLCTYLGDDAGSRVHKGSVYRGDLFTIRGVIWFSDIRDFTRMSQEMNRNDVIDLINQLWEITEDVLKRHGGEILKFLGDGCLAVFSVPDMSRRSSVFESDDAPVSNARKRLAVDSDDEGGDMTGRDLCQRVRRAAHEFQHRLASWREERLASAQRGAECGVGLHYGDASYGIVGGPSRLDFTVIGSSVNLASRVESVCSKIEAQVLASEEFVRRDGDHACWEDRGAYAVKGVVDPVLVYELRTAKRARRVTDPSPFSVGEAAFRFEEEGKRGTKEVGSAPLLRNENFTDSTGIVL
jgi:adenylate cyclase